MSSQFMMPNLSASKGIDFSKVDFNNMVLVGTNPNPTYNNTGAVTLDTGSTLYVVYYVTMKPYFSVPNTSVVGNYITRYATNCAVTANNRSIWRSASFDGSKITIGVPFAGETTHWESTILYQIFGIVGTEL